MLFTSTAFRFQFHLWKCVQIFDLEIKSEYSQPGSPNPKYESDNSFLYIIPLIVYLSVFSHLLIIDMKQNKYKYQQAFGK